MPDPEATQQVIVTYDSNCSDAKTAALALAKDEPQVYRNFAVLSFRATAAGIPALKAIPGVLAVHQPPSKFRKYPKILSYIDRTFQWDDDTRVGCPVNISVSEAAGPYSENEPMNVATYAAACAGLVFVFAAGNDGPAENSLNRWSLAPWVISVGAADREGKALWQGSSIGVPNDPVYHPTVVAPGKDIPVLAVPDAEQVHAHGTAVVGVMLRKTDSGGGAIESGTSLAAPVVSRICMYISVFLQLLYSTDEKMRNMMASGQIDINDAFWLSQMEPLSGLLPALRKQGVRFQMGYNVMRCKRMIEDMARPMPGYAAHQVGAGFVDEEIAKAYLTRFTLRQFLRIFVPEEDHAKATGDLDTPIIPEGIVNQVLETELEAAKVVDGALQ